MSGNTLSSISSVSNTSEVNKASNVTVGAKLISRTESTNQIEMQQPNKQVVDTKIEVEKDLETAFETKNTPISAEKVEDFTLLKDGLDKLDKAPKMPKGLQDGITSEHTLKNVKQEVSVTNINKNSNFQDTLASDTFKNPKAMEGLMKFMKDNGSVKNFECLVKINGIASNKELTNEQKLGSLNAVFQKYIKNDAPSKVNLVGTQRSDFEKALVNNNLGEALKALEPLTKTLKNNVVAENSKFLQSNDYKNIVTLSEINNFEKLPFRNQISALSEKIKEGGVNAEVLQQKKTDLLNEHIPKLPLNDPAGMKDFVASFKKDTGDSSHTRVDDINKALTSLEEVVKKGGSPKEQLKALDKCIKEVDKFTEKTKTVASSKSDLIDALSVRLKETRMDVSDKFSLTDIGKKFFIQEKLNELPKLDITSKNFDAKSEEMKDMIKFLTKNSPDSDFTKCITTSKDRLGDIKGFVESKYPKLTEEQRDTLSNKINEGFLAGLPNRINDTSDRITLNGKEFVKEKTLSEGSFGITHLFSDNEGNKVVVKEFKGDEEAGLNNFCEEVDAHRLVTGTQKHENVAEFKGVIFNTTGTKGFAVQEFADGGSLTNLRDTLKTFNTFLSQDDANLVRQYVAKQVVEGMAFMNETRNLAHLDIKPDNIMFDKTSGKVKIIDFGTVKKGDDHISRGIGTPIFMAPEVVGNKSGEVTKKADVWSTGVALQEIITGGNIFNTIDVEKAWDVPNKIESFAELNKNVREVRGTDKIEISEGVKIGSIEKFSNNVEEIKNIAIGLSTKMKDGDKVEIKLSPENTPQVILNGKDITAISLSSKKAAGLASKLMDLKAGETIEVKRTGDKFDISKGGEKIEVTKGANNFEITKGGITLKEGAKLGAEPTEIAKTINSMVTKQENRMTFTELAKMPYFTDSAGSDDRAKQLLTAMLDCNKAQKTALESGQKYDLKAQFNVKLQEIH